MMMMSSLLYADLNVGPPYQVSWRTRPDYLLNSALFASGLNVL